MEGFHEIWDVFSVEAAGKSLMGKFDESRIWRTDGPVEGIGDDGRGGREKGLQFHLVSGAHVAGTKKGIFGLYGADDLYKTSVFFLQGCGQGAGKDAFADEDDLVFLGRGKGFRSGRQICTYGRRFQAGRPNCCRSLFFMSPKGIPMM